MNRITFPKGSLSFKKLNDGVDPQPKCISKQLVKDYIFRKKHLASMKEFYPIKTDFVETLNSLPSDLYDSYSKSWKIVQQVRKELKPTAQTSMSNTYEIKFKHPKWYPMIGEIVVVSDKENISSTLKKVLVDFQNKKKNYRIMRIKTRNHQINSLKSKLTYNISGGVIYMPNLVKKEIGVYMDFLKREERKIVFSDKLPKEETKYLGIELEFIAEASSNELGSLLYDAGLGRYVTLKDDASIKSDDGNDDFDEGFHSHELCILVKENEYKDVLKKICGVLRDVNATVNKSCGMHVHLDMRKRNVEQAYQNLISSQGILLKMNPKSRTDKWAKKNPERDFEIAKNKSDRYYGINPSAMHKHQTIEIRIHSGTVEYTKISNWIDILLQVANHSGRIVKSFISIRTFCEEFNMPANLIEYINVRVTKFKSDDHEVEAESGAA